MTPLAPTPSPALADLTDAALLDGIHAALDRIRDNYRRAYDADPHWLYADRAETQRVEEQHG